MIYPTLFRLLLSKLDPETAHHLGMFAIRAASTLRLTKLLPKIKSSRVEAMGLSFDGPFGLAAGFDKNAMAIRALGEIGFSHVEIGTVTAIAQSGNETPRLFRLKKDRALINRMGFNNHGVDAFVKNVQASRFYQNKIGILGLNIGKNADTPMERALDDYVHCLKKVYPYASYVTVNISSPNTKNLRQLQDASELDTLLSGLKRTQAELTDQHQRHVPIALKIAPDLDAEQIKTIADALIRHRIEAVIATNTTISRTAVQGMQHAEEMGGLSGVPVFDASNHVIASLKKELGNDIPIIGVGGILSGTDAKAKIAAGAALVQLYTGLIYRGPALIKECAAALAAH